MSQYEIQNPPLTYSTDDIYINESRDLIILDHQNFLLLHIIVLRWLNISPREFFPGLTSNMGENICQYSRLLFFTQWKIFPVLRFYETEKLVEPVSFKTRFKTGTDFF